MGFEDIVAAIEAGRLLANKSHANQEHYAHQRLLFVELHQYVYVVPCPVTGEHYHLITLFPSRKATRDLRRKSP